MKKFIFIFLWVFFVLACEEIINEENISNNVVIAVAPIENTALKTGEQINYNWQNVVGASNYKLQIASPNFGSTTQVQLDTLIPTTSFSIDSLKSGSYEWRVRALNSAFSTSFTTNGFTVEK